jgi:CDP-glycerol glycerophosphotransferase (TagB/SpsB family)
MNIKTVEICHGINSGIEYQKKFIFPDKICVYGKKDKEILIKARIPKKIIEITGDVRNKKVKEMNKINIDLKRKNILFLTQGPAFTIKQTIKIIEPIFEWIKKNPEWNLTIKLHPDDRYYLLYWFYSLKYGIKTKIIKNTDLAELIDNSDIVITKNSTAGIECVAKYKPVLIEWIDSEKYFKLFNEYFDTEFYDLKTLDEQIKKVISPNYFEKYKEQRKNFLDDYSAGYGTAPEKIAKIIKEMMSKK